MKISYMNRFFTKHSKKIITLMLCIMVVFSFPSRSYALTLEDITSDAIKDKENKIDEAEAEREKLESALSNLEELKKELESSRDNLKNYVKELDLKLAQIEARIEELNVMISIKELEIAQAELELKEAMETEQAQYDAMKLRIQFMYEQGESNYFAMLLSADNFADMINKADYIEQLSAYDRKKLDEYAATTEYVRVCKAELEAHRAFLDEAKASTVSEQEVLMGLIDEKKTMIDTYENDIATKEAAIAEYEEDLAMQEELISALEAAVMEEKKEILAENGIVITYDGGKLTWPCPSYTRISSPYGWRIHPTLGVNKYHNGVDMAAPKGTDILAAYSGEVVAAAYNSTMGNYVLMNHGNGLYTIYMHASKLCVTEGEIIIEGEKIAEVGSTGRSTGPHLHFGVRKDGEYVDPMGYLNK